MYTPIHRAISNATKNTPAKWTEADIETAITNAFQADIQPELRTPQEHTLGIMILSSAFGFDQHYIIEEVTHANFETDLKAMFTNAFWDVAIAEIQARLDNSVENPQPRSKEFNTTVPVATRLSKMPNPIAIIRLLKTTIDSQLTSNSTQRDLTLETENTLKVYRGHLWKSLDPVQQTHLIVTTKNHYKTEVIEDDQNYTNWTDVIESGYLYHHLSGILTANYESIPTLSDKQIALVEDQLTQLSISNQHTISH